MAIAAFASSSELISTNPNPLDLLVNLSMMTVADTTVPACENDCFKESSVTEYGKPPTYNFAAILLLLKNTFNTKTRSLFFHAFCSYAPLIQKKNGEKYRCVLHKLIFWGDN
jgi:hypothetical protein